MSSVPVSAVSSQDLDSILRENRVFPPPPEFTQKAYVKSLEEYERMYKRSIDDPEAFWAEAAGDLHWFKRWDKVLEWNLPWAKWFVGGQLNLSYNCVDRHALGERRDKTALIWEGEPGEIRTLTYGQMHAEVQRFASGLKTLGVKKGDRVAVYMGMTPELAIALLACARIGAVHSVIFGGFAANAIADRVNDSECVAIITQDTSYRRGHDSRAHSWRMTPLPRSAGTVGPAQTSEEERDDPPSPTRRRSARPDRLSRHRVPGRQIDG